MHPRAASTLIVTWNGWEFGWHIKTARADVLTLLFAFVGWGCCWFCADCIVRSFFSVDDGVTGGVLPSSEPVDVTVFELIVDDCEDGGGGGGGGVSVGTAGVFTEFVVDITDWPDILIKPLARSALCTSSAAWSNHPLLTTTMSYKSVRIYVRSIFLLKISVTNSST